MGNEPSLLSGVDPVDPPEGGTDPNAVDPNAVDPNAVDPNADPNADPAPETKTEEEIRTSILAELREGVPETPDGYEIPDIEGLDKEALAGSNVFTTMREAAHEAGMKPDKWAEFVGKWAAAEKEEIETYKAEQLALLGKDEAAVATRLGTLSGALTRMLPKDEAEALMALASSAGSVKALERLISKQPLTATTTTVTQKDDAATIKKLMDSKEYMGYDHERDPEVVARVDRFFAEGGTLKA